MQVFHTIADLQQAISQAKQSGKTIGFVPTMGNLHDGHLALVQQAASVCDEVVASIFVNPLQFGANEDLDKYPRTLAADKDKLIAASTSYLFCPNNEEMYPAGTTSQTLVSVPTLSETHCGASRPGHFSGVATVVCKLFNIVQPNVAIFGKKDFQQLAVIRQMVKDLCLSIDIIGAPIVRDETGLALSSRNTYLSEQERAIAPLLYKVLNETKQSIQNGDTNFTPLENKAKQTLTSAGLQPDYFTVCEANSLLPATSDNSDLVILAAVYLGNTRLIDNVTLELP